MNYSSKAYDNLVGILLNTPPVLILGVSGSKLFYNMYWGAELYVQCPAHADTLKYLLSDYGLFE